MIKNRDLYEEIKKVEEAIEKNKDDDLIRCLLKTQTLIIKLLHNIRTNLVAIMKAKNIEMVTKKNEEKK